MSKILSICCITVMISTMSIAQDHETRSLNKFDEVKVSTGVAATLLQSSENKVVIEADGIDLDRVITEVKGDDLFVRVDNKNLFGMFKKYKVKVEIHFTEELEGISVSSGADIQSKDVLQSEELKLNASSGGGMKLEVDAEELGVHTSSGSSITLRGEADEAKISSSSGSGVKAADLVIKKAKISCSSGAGIKLTVKEHIKASASSGGSVKYYGHPSFIDISKSSGGSVKKAS